jgi:hypothetical protein
MLCFICWIIERGGESVMRNLYHLLILLTTMYIPLTYSTMFISSSSIYYCIININIHQCIINNNRHIHTIHNTPIFYVETQCGRKPQNDFLICQRITFKEAPTSNSPAPTEGGSNPLVSRLQPEGKLQLPNSMATTRRRIQPLCSPWLQPEGGYNHLSFPHPAP